MEHPFFGAGPGCGPGHRWQHRFTMPFGARAWMAGPPPGGPFPGFMPIAGGPMFGGRGRGRVRRGAIRAAILVVLADRPMHGYEIMTELGERSGGMWRPSPGSVYPTLQQLEDEDLVSAEDVDGKRTFRLTDAGRAEAEKLGERGAPWESIDEGVSDAQRALYKAALQTSVAASQVAQAGSDEQIAAAQSALDDARKRLYRLLAEDTSSAGDAAPAG